MEHFELAPTSMKTPRHGHLFAELRLGALDLRHRIVLAGTPRFTRNFDGDERFAQLGRYYGARSTPGGLVICSVAPRITGRQDRTSIPGIRSTADVNGWRGVADEIHSRGGLVVARIGEMTTSQDLPDDDGVDEALDAYRAAAENAGDAGFDGIELLCTKGTLPARFLAHAREEPSAARCATGFCGTGFLAEAIQALTAVWPVARVGACLSAPAAPVELKSTRDALAVLGVFGVAVVHVVSAPNGTFADPTSSAAGLRSSFVGGLIVDAAWSAQSADAAIARGVVDAVSPEAFVVHADLPLQWSA
jgi:N-ethylmaleimide reductase